MFWRHSSTFLPDVETFQRKSNRCLYRSSTLSSLNSTIASSLNSTTPADYYTVFEEVSKINVHLNIAERLWAAWYLWWQNDTLATGIMSFLMHEIVYFGRCLPYMIIDAIPAFNKYKIQNVSVTGAPRGLRPPFHLGGRTHGLACYG